MNNNIRLTNLHLLIGECGGTQLCLAEKLGIEYKELIKYFRNKYHEIDDNFARIIEQKLNKPLGWMDRRNCDLALANEEWQLLESYRNGNNRDKLFLLGLASLVSKG